MKHISLLLLVFVSISFVNLAWADYYSEKRACAAAQPLAPAAFIADDGGCKEMVSDTDGRSRFLCMADGAIYDTYGQCRWYCR